MNLIKRLYLYQKVRFPLQILLFTTLTSVLSSAAVMHYDTSWIQAILVFIAGMLFLFHIRVLDESRDFTEDAVKTPDSPVHNGTVTLKLLFLIDAIGIILIAVISVYLGYYTLILMISIFAFTTLAWRDFFLKKLVRKSKVFYHILNSPQMILLQLYIFAGLTGSFYLTGKMWILLFFVYNNIFILEIARKISTDTNKKNFEDTYNARMGLGNAVMFTYVLSILGFALATFLIYLLTSNHLYYILVESILFIVLTYSCYKYVKTDGKKAANLFLVTVVLEYVVLNGLICIAAI